LREKSREDQLRWLALGHISGVSIVSFDSEVDTYALIDRSDIVVTAGSTVGIEAVYWGRPSITLGPSYYSELNVTHYPTSTAELQAMISSNNLNVDRELTIPYGYYMKTFGEAYKHYEPKTLFSGKFLGIDLHKVTIQRERWLRFKRFVTKPYRVVLRLITVLVRTKQKLQKLKI
jgi:capsule polysaccharide export protein KpsC/LpsZ